MKAQFALLTISFIALAGCSKGNSTKQNNPAGSDNTSNTTESGNTGLNINGIYDTDFGDLELKETNKKVTGSYTYAGNGGIDVKGSLNGDLKDKTLSFNWEQVQGDQKSGGTGNFEFSTDGKSFNGTWSDTKGGTGEWNGTKK